MKNYKIPVGFEEVYTRLEELSRGLIEMMKMVDETGISIPYDPARMDLANRNLEHLTYECRNYTYKLGTVVNDNSDSSLLPYEYIDLMIKDMKELEGVFYVIAELLQLWEEAYYDYSKSGSSDSPPNPEGLAAWEISMGKKIPLLIHVMEKIINDFRELEYQDQLTGMGCVYASPQMMDPVKMIINEDTSDARYPYNHAVTEGKEASCEENEKNPKMVGVYGGPHFRDENETTRSMEIVYGSPRRLGNIFNIFKKR